MVYFVFEIPVTAPCMSIMRFLSEFVSGFMDFCPPRVMLFQTVFGSCRWGAHRCAHVLCSVSGRVFCQGRAGHQYHLGKPPRGARWASRVAAAVMHPPQCSCQKASHGGGFPSDARGSISGMVQQMCSFLREREISRLHPGLQSWSSGRRLSSTRR